MVVKFRNTIWPPPPQLSLHKRAALSRNSNGTRSVYSRENPKRSLYCEMSVGLMSFCLSRWAGSGIVTTMLVSCWWRLSVCHVTLRSPPRRLNASKILYSTPLNPFKLYRYLALVGYSYNWAFFTDTGTQFSAAARYSIWDKMRDIPTIKFPHYMRPL
jgi:hypothetical protein